MKITIKKGKPPTANNYWVGYCHHCTTTWNFHFFGATLGYGLEHLRRHST